MEVKTNEPKRNRAIPLLAVLVCIALAVLLVFKVLLPNKRYGEAQALYATGQYEEAMGAFEALNGYRDSAAQAEKCRKELAYGDALALYEAGQYEGAIAAFTTLIGFRDSAAQIVACQTALKDKDYSAAVTLYDAGQYEAAAAAFTALIGHRDSAEWIEKCQYALRDRAYEAALALRTSGQYEEAIAAFTSLIGHRDSVAQIDLCKKDRAYDEADALHASGQYETAIAAFTALNGYRDSAAQIELCRKDIAYDEAVALQAAGRYQEAIAAFEALNGHKDSAAQIEACHTVIQDRAYTAAMALYEAGSYQDAIAAFEALGDYRDSGAWAERCREDMYKWPNRPVNVVVPASAGGGLDNMVRLLNQYFMQKTGKSIVVDNIPSLPGYEKTYQANADGYNFLFGTYTIFTTELEGKLTYDWDDYEMVAFCSTPCNDYCIAVRADSPYQTILELLDAIKANPNALTGGTTLTGQPLYCELALENALGYELHTTDVGYAFERNAALLGGHVDYIINTATSCAPYVQSGDFRILAVFGEERYPIVPDVPTFKEAGIDFSFPAQPMVWLAPKGTPREICEAFNQILREIHDDTDYQDSMVNMLYSAVYHVFGVEESIRQAQAYKDALAPFVAGSASPSTSASEFKSIEAGAVNDGDTVKKVQQRLVDLYYMPYPEKDSSGRGVVTAVYGSMCAKAVTKFQERNGLKQTGQCDRDTYDRLMADDAVAYSMKEKDKLDIVKAIQEALIQKGYLTGKANGYCGTDTVAAVKAFQKANDLTVTGQADTETLRLLLGY